MHMTLLDTLKQYWRIVQGSLFPTLEEELGPLTDKQQQLISILGIVRVESFVPAARGGVGRPPKSRQAVARAFVAKAVYNFAVTRNLLEALTNDANLRRICGWEKAAEVPDESTFSRAFAEFADSRLAERVHTALIEQTQKDRLVGHISRDSTEIEGREKPGKKPTPPAPAKGKRGGSKKGERAAAEPSRLERQLGMELPQILEELPRGCDIGNKKNSKGYVETWIGYKLHLDVADGQIPISCVLTSASVHDSQVAIALAKMSAARVTNMYDLMDSAYDAGVIEQCSRQLGHVPLIDRNPRRDAERKQEMEVEARRQKVLGWKPAEVTRYNERTTVERVNGRLKEEFGGRTVRVRGQAKVWSHLMFGILALTADQLLRLVPKL